MTSAGAPNTQILLTYQKAFQYFRSGVIWLNEQGTIIGGNQKLSEFLQYEEDQLRGKTIFEIDPRLNLLAWKKIWRSLQKNEAYHAETEYITADGLLIPVNTDGVLIQSEGNSWALLIIENLMDSRRLLDLLEVTTTAGKVGSWEYDLVKEEVTVTGECQRLLGLEGIISVHPKATLINMLSKHITPKDLEHLLKKMETSIKKGGTFEDELLFKTAQGSYLRLWINGFTQQSELEQTIKIFGAIKDVSRVTAKSEELYLTQFTVDHANEMIFWVRPDGTFAYVNQAVCDRLGFAREELLSMQAKDIAPDFDDTSREQLWLELREKKFMEHEIELRTKSGNRFPIFSTLNYIKFKDQEFNCVFSVDYSQRKKRENELQLAKQKVEELSKRLKDENVLLREEISSSYNFNNIITCSPKYRKVLRQVAQVAASNATVLIMGETGTGKELLARSIHSLSEREEGVMIKVNCATLPEQLFESELFGHEKGAFTGAAEQKKGRFELADGATIFLDEIGEMPLHLQAKLLRVLQEGEFERLGGTKTLKVNVRVIAATNRNLEKMVAEGKFREDLYYRLNVFPIINLPLRERKEDIPVLIKYFAKKYGDQQGKRIEKIPQSDLDLMQQYYFPGNIRELENIVERAVILSSGKTLNLRTSFQRSRSKEGKQMKKHFPTFEEMQKQHILKALKRTDWRVTGPKGAGRLLGLNDRTLASKMRKLGIHKKDYLK